MSAKRTHSKLPHMSVICKAYSLKAASYFCCLLSVLTQSCLICLLSTKCTHAKLHAACLTARMYIIKVYARIRTYARARSGACVARTHVFQGIFNNSSINICTQYSTTQASTYAHNIQQLKHQHMHTLAGKLNEKKFFFTTKEHNSPSICEQY